MAEKFQDQEFLEFIVKSIVGNPGDVKVDRTVDEMGVLLTLNLNPEDMGYVIGKKGATARSIRTLLKIVGAKNNARVNLKIVEPEGSQRPPRPADSGFRSDSPSTSDSAPTEEAVSTEEADTDIVDDLKI